ncbi:MAG: hypothetical protein ABJH63_20150 [Rhizobiaceae bacterium]
MASIRYRWGRRRSFRCGQSNGRPDLVDLQRCFQLSINGLLGALLLLTGWVATGLATDVYADEVAVRERTGPVRPEGPPRPHLIDMAKTVLGQLKDGDLGDAKTAERLQSIIRKSRLKRWSGSPLTGEDVTEDLGQKFDLYTDNDEEHREAVEELQAARTAVQRRIAAKKILELNGRLKSIDPGSDEERAMVQEVISGFEKNLSDRFELNQQQSGVEVGENGDYLGLEWNPSSGDFLIRLRPGDDDKEYIIQSGVVVERDEDGVMKMRTIVDETPVRVIGQAKRKRISQSLFGEWHTKDGEIWTIGRQQNKSESDAKSGPNQKKDTLATLQAELKATKSKKVFLWINGETGENIIQTKYKRLPEPFEFMKQESDDFYKDKIRKLENTIAELQASDKTLPIDQFDPLNLDEVQVRTPSILSIIRDDGYEFSYTDVSYDGNRLTGRRTLSDLRDLAVGGLPDHIRRELISSWSPPEWVELIVIYRPRTDDVVLAGNRWRLHVTSSGISGGVTKIHSPYVEEVLRLERTDPPTPSPVSLRFLVSPSKQDSTPPESLAYDKPFYVELVFDRPPEVGKHQVSLKLGAKANNAIMVYRDESDPLRFLSKRIVLDELGND